MAAHGLYALAWLGFGLGHSWLAGAGPKAWGRPRLGPWYRLAYNAVAAVHLAAVWGLGWWLLGDRPPFARPVPWPAVMVAMQVAGVAVLAWSARHYDLGRLAGTAQLRHRVRGTLVPEDEPLRLDGPHRWVRHPLYLGAVLVLWGRAVDPFSLATAAWASLYFLIGAAFEERRLLRLYGDAYARYRRRVPGLVPWKGPVHLEDPS